MSSGHTTKTQPPNIVRKTLVDEYGNTHYSAKEIARGGQGVVFRTGDADLAIKQPLDANGELDRSVNLIERFQNIRLLPLPPRIHISLPLAILRDEPGYVMRLLNGMESFNRFQFSGSAKSEMIRALDAGTLSLPRWLSSIPDRDVAMPFLHYANTGSTRRRLVALSKCASILARLHLAGFVYGDISPNNVFLDGADSPEVWLIDADNLRYERVRGGGAVYTPGYGAPEIIGELDSSRPRTDCWAFAVMAFSMLTLCNPFVGKRVLEADEERGGWDSEPIGGGQTMDPDEQARAGLLPFIDDDEDDSNAPYAGTFSLPRELVLTAPLAGLFQETLGAGRTLPHRRPAMAYWARELAMAFFRSLTCPECAMSYFAGDHARCPYCGVARPAHLRAATRRGEMVIQGETTEFALAHCLFHPFSFEHGYEAEYEATLDIGHKSVRPVRGTKPFPADLSFEFVEAEK